MKIFIDIGHPAHVHYFRNFIKIMEGKGHHFFITARDKEVTHDLLNYYKIKYSSRGKGGAGIWGKFLYLFKANFILFKYARSFKPDLFLSFGSAYAAQVSKLIGKPHIAFDDTEHSKIEHLMYAPFTDAILTPSCFFKALGKKQIYFDGYMELCYLHKNYFTPEKSIRTKLELHETDKYIVIRFVSWGANHDIGHYGLKTETKMKIINLLKNDYKLFISSEAGLPQDLKQYELKIAPSDLHSVLAGAYLYIGEGSTTASECSVLGIPNVYINSLTVGYCKEQDEKYNLCFHLKNDSKAIEFIKNLISNENLSEEYSHKKEIMLKDKINVTDFMVWFVENYSNSFHIMKENPDYQYNFR